MRKADLHVGTLLLDPPSDDPAESRRRLRPHAPALYQTVSYEQADLDDLEQSAAGERYFYARHGAPNECEAASLIARLESHGLDLPAAVDAVLFGSGMAAVAAALEAVLPADGRAPVTVVAASPLYSASRTLLLELQARGRIELLSCPSPELATVEAVCAQAASRIAVVYCEVISNPQLRVADLEALGGLAGRLGAALVVDATFCTPLLCQPLRYGAALVLHSATKYLSGHGDVCAGVVTGAEPLLARLREQRKVHGAILDPFAAWLLQRSLRTLRVRLERQLDNAEFLARALEERAAAIGIRRVIYPGLPSHPDHEVARRLLARPGAMLSFVVEDRQRAQRVYERVRVIRRVASLGDVETLMMFPAATWRAVMSREEQAKVGIEPGMLRLSVGIEDADDLLADLLQSLRG